MTEMIDHEWCNQSRCTILAYISYWRIFFRNWHEGHGLLIKALKGFIVFKELSVFRYVVKPFLGGRDTVDYLLNRITINIFQLKWLAVHV